MCTRALILDNKMNRLCSMLGVPNERMLAYTICMESLAVFRFCATIESSVKCQLACEWHHVDGVRALMFLFVLSSITFLMRFSFTPACHSSLLRQKFSPFHIRYRFDTTRPCAKNHAP
jgi:hypothetical protein